ncbi:hypothetical protein PDN63_23715 [Bacillus cereus]|nr:hypothetical protein [Bacillus cereus]MDA2457314.1 hypothetical protein [Bacillus cereus]
MIPTGLEPATSTLRQVNAKSTENKKALSQLIERHFTVLYDPGEARTHDLHSVKVDVF